jgi:hypothetical protein
LILEWLRALRFELRNGLFVGAEVKAGAQRDREVGSVGGDAETRIVTGPNSENKSIRKSRSIGNRSYPGRSAA